MKKYRPCANQPNDNNNESQSNDHNQLNNNDTPICSNLSNDFGPNPFAINIRRSTLQNNYFRTALWTGKCLQVTLMCIKPGEDIGLEMHPNLDQFLYIEQGQGTIIMGDEKDNLTFEKRIFQNNAIIIPAKTWHNLINKGRISIKLYSIYSPPQHAFGTVHITKPEDEEHLW